jgi:tRNA(adenine34) deaminase
MIREYKIKKVVFALPSPFMGGFSKWNILQDDELAEFPPFFSKPPEVVSSVLEAEAKVVFDKTPLWMFGSNARSNKRN